MTTPLRVIKVDSKQPVAVKLLRLFLVGLYVVGGRCYIEMTGTDSVNPTIIILLHYLLNTTCSVDILC